MIKRVGSLVLIVIMAVLTLNLSTPVSATPTFGRPQKNMVQSVTDGETVMWMDDLTITGVTVYLSTALSMDIHNTAYPWFTSSLLTMRPPNSACLEGVVYHDRGVDNVIRQRFLVVPWCAGNNTAIYDVVMDTAWWNKYTTVQTWPNWNWSHPVTYSDKTLSLRIEKIAPLASNCWRARLWNYQTQAWETIGNPNVQCGTPNDPVPVDGWVGIEEHYRTNTVCTSLGFYNVNQGRNAMVQHGIGAAWQFPTASVTSFTLLPATQCSPSPWHVHTQENSGGFTGNGIVMCDPILQPNCD